MKITISEETLKKHNVTRDEAVMLIVADLGIDIKKTMKDLDVKGLASRSLDMFNPDKDSYFLSHKGSSILTDLILDSDKSIPTEDDLTDLSLKLKELFPKGKNPRCNMYWSDGPILISKRLRAFFKKYGRFDDKDIIDATKAYVDSFNGDYGYMQLLKYFIFKDTKGADGVVEFKSELLNLLENKEERAKENAQGTNYDWRANLA